MIYSDIISYQIRKIAGCACAGNAGKVFPTRRLQRKPLVSDPGMHHCTCVKHVPWCMSGSLTCGGENIPGIPGACAPAILRIWHEAHDLWIGHRNYGASNGTCIITTLGFCCVKPSVNNICFILDLIWCADSVPFVTCNEGLVLFKLIIMFVVRNICIELFHLTNVTWASRRFTSLTSRRFVQKLVAHLR